MSLSVPPFRSALGEPGWDRLLALGEEVRIEAGASVLRRGDPPAWLYLIVVGSLEVVDPRTNPPTVLTTYGPGHIVGEMSVLDGVRVSADVRAAGPAVVRRFSLERLNAGLRDDPTLGSHFYRALSSMMGARLRALTNSAVAGAFARREHAPKAEGGAGDAEGPDPFLQAALQLQADPAPRVVRLGGERVTIGQDRDCGLRLVGPRIAPIHAELVPTDDGWRVVTTGERAVVVDGASVASAPLRDGSSFQVAGYTLTLAGEELTVRAPAPPFAIHARSLSRRIGEQRVLDDVSFTVLAGEVVAVVGPSGAGKSSLIAALTEDDGHNSGEACWDGEDLRALLRRVPELAAVVPQDDIVLPELTVEESLRFAARLRLASGSQGDREAAVHRVLRELGIDRIAASRIGDPEERGISGGQRKRVNIGQELLTEATRVLFLDEPTSGLDPRSAGDIARLARRLADAGRVVVLVTHDLSDALLTQVDHLLVLVPGGRLAWFGPPEEACAHFGVTHPAAIFDRLPDHAPAEWQARFWASPAAERWVRTRSSMASASLRPSPPPTRTDPASWVGQWRVLVARAARVKLRDRTALSVLVLQPLVVAAVMLLVFSRATSGLLFLLVLSSFWFGMSAAVRELIVDRVVWRRERRIGVTASAWVLAKAAVLAVAVAVQCAALTLLAYAGADLGTMGFSAAGLLGTAVLTGWVGLSTGLLVSASWRRSEAAVGTIVLLLIPQLAFVGMLMPLDQTGPVARGLSWLTPVRYALHLALRCGDRLQYLKLGEWHERPVPGELFLLGLRPPGEGSWGLSAEVLAGVLAACGAVLLALTIGRLRASVR